MKKCSKCQVTKTKIEFSVEVEKKDGCQNYCKACRSSQDKAYYLKNHARKLYQMKLYRERNKQKEIA